MWCQPDLCEWFDHLDCVIYKYRYKETAGIYHWYNCDLNIYCGNIYWLFCLDWKMKFVCGKNKKFRNSSFVSYAFNYKLPVGFKFEVIWDYHGISSSLF